MKLLYHISSVAILRALSAGIQFLTAVILARVLGANGYGIYAVAISFANVLAYFGSLGMQHVAVRHVAAFGEQRDYAKAKRFVSESFTSVVICSGVLALSFCALYLSTSNGGSFAGLRRQEVFALCGLVPLFALLRWQSSVIQGSGRVKLGVFVESIGRQGVFLVLIVALLYLGSTVLSVPKAVLEVNIASGFTAALLVCFILYKLRFLPVFTLGFRGGQISWKSEVAPILIAGGAQMMNSQLDILILGFLTSPGDVGVYQAAARVSLLVGMPLLATNLVVAPMISRFYTVDDQSSLRKTLRSSARISTVFAVPMVLSVFLLWEPILRLFGPEFVSAKLVLFILVGAWMVIPLFGNVDILANMTGRSRDNAVAVFVSLVLNASLNLLLIPRMGTIGAAVATAASLVSWRALLSFQIFRRLNLNATIFARAV